MIISEEPVKISSCEDVAYLMWNIINAEHETDQEREHFWVIGLNSRHKVKYIELTSLGIVNTAYIHTRETFRLAIMRACKNIIVCHNHPGGDPTPSPEDIKVTETLRAAGKIIGISVLDHVIIGETPYYYSLECAQVGESVKKSEIQSSKTNKIDWEMEHKIFNGKRDEFQKQCDGVQKVIDEINAVLAKREKEKIEKN